MGECEPVLTAPVEVALTAVVDAALRATSALLGMEFSYVGGLTATTFTYTRLHGHWPGLRQGEQIARADSFCARMLDGAPPSTSDAAGDPSYASVPFRDRLGICSYAGVPILAADGTVLGTLAAMDHRAVPVDPAALTVLRALAQGLAAAGGPQDGQPADGQPPIRLRRTPSGWLVETPNGGAHPADDSTAAMVLADLLADDLTPAPRPKRPERDLDEVERLRLSVVQLEHALASRVVVEQAIGVLAERHRIRPREAFERLRRVARGKGRRVHDLAREVVASIEDPAIPLPADLAAPSRRGGAPSARRPSPATSRR